MDISVREQGDECIVYISGKISFLDHDLFKEMIENMASSKAKTCILDLFDCTQLDSAGLGFFMHAHESFKQHEIELHVRNAHDHVERLLNIARFKDFMSINQLPAEEHLKHF
ncbi:conserved hypothetical protein [Candidatus Terasakiella magnetica]|uniref:Anti-sigma factor antagonist n=1 Tax=Candidatus Terasakiella magnetica TaxID=1867952 RepID=A0A1C3RDB5_9PROT|nr:STAS domain-containing protein [Candidatus Terasakiella magnetica]SCA55221.1 conserved hypothetical protein [Candidatus Terasakiella magnetica]